ncbi:hypothetical protein B0H34DRAFT_496409 [Crassisporium funariophilum]|nr:hypothetical protein B0H34DRAFT_496409 [Crassisporium funariophilum]
MFPTAARLSKASRAPLTPKRGNKDFYKGTRQAFLPGGRRTGAPGKHVIGGSAKYRLLDDKVRVYVAPPIHEIESSPLKPYVALGAHLTKEEERSVFGKFIGPSGLTPRHFLRIAREHTYAQRNPESPYIDADAVPDWIAARLKLGTMASLARGVSVKEERPVQIPGAKASEQVVPHQQQLQEHQRHRAHLRELEVVN